MIPQSICVFLFVVLSFTCNEDKYVEYKPHFVSNSNEQKYFGDPELNSSEFTNTIKVLEYYGEDYKLKNGNIILITKELSNNWELVWNYSTKANGDVWLKTHNP